MRNSFFPSRIALRSLRHLSVACGAIRVSPVVLHSKSRSSKQYGCRFGWSVLGSSGGRARRFAETDVGVRRNAKLQVQFIDRSVDVRVHSRGACVRAGGNPDRSASAGTPNEHGRCSRFEVRPTFSVSVAELLESRGHAFHSVPQ